MNLNAVREYLKALRPRGPWTITAIPVDSLPGARLPTKRFSNLGNSFEVTRETRLVPFGKETVISLAAILAAPLLLLVPMVLPLQEIVTRVLGIFL